MKFLLILIQFFSVYYYNPSIKLFLIVIAWALLLLCNGLSNYFSIKLAKLYYKESPKLQSVDEWAVLFYETLNPGFIIFTFVVLIVLFLGII